MIASPIKQGIDRLRQGALLRADAGLSDVQLLERYLVQHDPGALTALVRRHAGMVWGVCRRLLHHPHDAEDAFQATFLVLVRRAAAIAPRELVANWLHGVAWQTALKARATAAKRRSREKQVSVMPEPQAAAPEVWSDLQPLLDRELARLPARHRAAVLLCDLEGKTRKEAARELGVPEGTVAGWLARGRTRLAKELGRHGVTLSGGALAAMLSQSAATAAAPNAVLAATVRATSLLAADSALAAGVVSPGAAALADGMVRSMFVHKVKNVTALVLATALLVAGGRAASSTLSPPPAQAQEAPRSAAPLPPAKQEQGDAAAALAGRWLMTLPAGFQYIVTIRPASMGRVVLEKAVRFSGDHELRQGRLVRLEPVGPEGLRFGWELRSADELTLVAQPPVIRTGADYLGATLRRLAEGEEPVLQKGPVARDPARPGPMTQVLEAPTTRQTPPPPISAEEEKAAKTLERIKSEYRITKEPDYKAPVQYCLLLLGPDNPRRLWLASDGITLYVDRNGNGDLSEQGEAIPFRAEGFAAYFEDAGERGRRPLHIAVRQRDWEKATGGYWSVRAAVGSGWPMYAFAHKFAKEPDDAPVIHLGGPMRMGLYELQGLSLTRGGEAELNAYVACAYPGVERAFVDVDEWQRKDIHPLAEIRLPPKTSEADQILLRVPLARRC